MSRRVLAYVPDLMDRSKVSSAAEGVTFVSGPAELADQATADDLVVVDLMRPGVMDVLDHLAGEVVGFANHAERDLMEMARSRGCDQVMARSAFFSRLSDLLQP